MELFLPMLTALLVEGFKWSVNRIGRKATTWIIYLGVAILSFIWAYLKIEGVLTQAFLQMALTNVAIAVGTYEIIIKWIIKQGIITGVFKK